MPISCKFPSIIPGIDLHLATPRNSLKGKFPIELKMTKWQLNSERAPPKRRVLNLPVMQFSHCSVSVTTDVH